MFACASDFSQDEEDEKLKSAKLNAQEPHQKRKPEQSRIDPGRIKTIYSKPKCTQKVYKGRTLKEKKAKLCDFVK